MVRDGFHCRSCAAVVTSTTSRADHIIPVNRFANLDLANSLDNIQTLCLRCDKLKTARDK
ncbi:MAG: HNH endonuclease [Beijerinckiaceae bacterium]